MKVIKSGRPARKKPWTRQFDCRCKCAFEVTADDVDGYQYPDNGKPYGQRWQWRLHVVCPECGWHLPVETDDESVIRAAFDKETRRRLADFVRESAAIPRPRAEYGDFWDGRCGDPSPDIYRYPGGRD